MPTSPRLEVSAFDHADIEQHPTEDADETATLLQALHMNDSMQDDDSKSWTDAICGCPCSSEIEILGSGQSVLRNCGW